MFVTNTRTNTVRTYLTEFFIQQHEILTRSLTNTLNSSSSKREIEREQSAILCFSTPGLVAMETYYINADQLNVGLTPKSKNGEALQAKQSMSCFPLEEVVFLFVAISSVFFQIKICM